MNPSAPPRRWWLAAVAVLPAVAAFLALSADFRGRNAPVVDEIAYLTAAKPVFQRGDFGVLESFGTAPLPVLLEYGPAIRMHGDRVADTPWQDSPDDPAAVDVARITTSLVVGVPLLVLVVFWVFARTGSAWLGGWAGLMLALCPTFVAHATVACTDAGFALFFLLALLALGRLFERPTIYRFVAASVLVGLAVASKYGGVLLLPAAYLIGLTTHLRAANPPTDKGFFARAFIYVPLRLAALTMVAAVVVWGVTGFAWATPQAPQAGQPAAKALRLPSPLVGFIRQTAMTTAAYQEEHGIVMTRLHGTLYPNGHRLYYGYAFLAKSTLPELGCAVLAIFAPFLAGRGRRWTADGTATGIGVLLLAVALSLSAKQHGIRYLLAVYPLVFVLAATTLHRLGRAWLSAGVAVVLLAGQGIEAWSVAPWHVSYMNRLAGGPERAIDTLAAADGDWGQGRQAMTEFLKSEGETGVLFVPGNAADEEFYYGVRRLGWADYATPPCRYAAMGGAAFAHPPERFPRIAAFAPLPPKHVLAHSVYLYDLTDPTVWATYKAARQKPRHAPAGLTP